jgi:hypothetical protein
VDEEEEKGDPAIYLYPIIHFGVRADALNVTSTGPFSFSLAYFFFLGHTARTT